VIHLPAYDNTNLKIHTRNHNSALQTTITLIIVVGGRSRFIFILIIALFLNSLLKTFIKSRSVRFLFRFFLFLFLILP